jgi:hypothetical protein
MSKLKTVAKDGLLTLPDGFTIPLGSKEWHQWLADNRSFRFETNLSKLLRNYKPDQTKVVPIF